MAARAAQPLPHLQQVTAPSSRGPASAGPRPTPGSADAPPIMTVGQVRRPPCRHDASWASAACGSQRGEQRYGGNFRRAAVFPADPATTAGTAGTAGTAAAAAVDDTGRTD